MNFHNFVNNGIYEINSCKINWALVGALQMNFLFRVSAVMLNEYCLIFVLAL